jgi:hypothetical protein
MNILLKIKGEFTWGRDLVDSPVIWCGARHLGCRHLLLLIEVSVLYLLDIILSKGVLSGVLG